MKSSASKKRPGPAAAAARLAQEIIVTQASLRALSTSVGLQHPAGGGVWSLLSILASRGSLSVREAAEIRGVSRQYMIKLANQLENEGFVTLERDSKSFTLHLTPKGARALVKAEQKFEAYLGAGTTDMDGEKIESAIATIKELRKRITL